MKWMLFLGTYLVLVALDLRAAPFENLNFDLAQTNNAVLSQFGTGFGSTEDLLPGWRLFFGSDPQSIVQLDEAPIGAGPFASLIDHNHGGNVTSPKTSEWGLGSGRSQVFWGRRGILSLNYGLTESKVSFL